MQVRIGPAHYDLQRAVQLAKRDIALGQETTPYRRSCTEQSDFDRVDWHDESHSGRERSVSHAAILAVSICPDRKAPCTPQDRDLRYGLISTVRLCRTIPAAMVYDDRKIDDIIEDWSKTIPDAVWWVLGAVSGFIASHVIGRTVLKVSAFQHPVAAAIISLCPLAGFLLFRKKYE